MPERSCTLCPRHCRSARTPGDLGRCGMEAAAVIARAAPHFGEEPCISGSRGSGTVFFSGCALGCVFCQNRAISTGGVGEAVSTRRLRAIFEEFEAMGLHNINLVTPTHFLPAILQALAEPRPALPVVWNSSGYESATALRKLAGKIQIYMPDMKYALSAPAARYADAPDYPARAREAIGEMYRQVGPYRMDRDGLLQSGLLIRHLILPGQTENTRRVIDWVSDSFEPGTILFSLMSQYTPCDVPPGFPELARPVTREEYELCLRHLDTSRIETGYVQDLDASGTQEIPAFDLTGVR